MASIRSNRLLWLAFAIALAFWIIAPLVPNPYLSSALSFALLCSSVMTFYQYTPPAYRVLFYQERYYGPDGGRGSHLAVLAVFLFAIGSAASGLYGLWWNFHGQPPDWIGSPQSQFGRACHIAAFCLMQVSPQITTDGFKIKAQWWVVAIISTVLLLVGFYFGMQFQTFETSDAFRSMRPV